MKRFLIFALTAALLLSLLACSPQKEYAKDVPAAGLMQTALDALADGTNYSTAQSGYFDDYFEIPSYTEESAVRFATDTNNINEFGIFRVSDGNGSEMRDLLKNYLKDSFDANRDWYDSYIPAETPKLRDAEVKLFGTYAVYAIADSSTRAAFFNAVEGALQVS